MAAQRGFAHSTNMRAGRTAFQLLQSHTAKGPEHNAGRGSALPLAAIRPQCTNALFGEAVMSHGRIGALALSWLIGLPIYLMADSNRRASEFYNGAGRWDTILPSKRPPNNSMIHVGDPQSL
jgi:hypothetical protein